MRGTFVDQGGLFSYIAPEARVPVTHPLRKIREIVRDVLGELTRSLGKLYASEGRPSIPPEQLLSALLLQVFYGIRSERQLMEQLDYNLLYRWFARRPDLGPDDLHEEPQSAADRRSVCQVHEQTSQPSGGQAAVVGRAFFGGRNADRPRQRAWTLSSRRWNGKFRPAFIRRLARRSATALSTGRVVQELNLVPKSADTTIPRSHSSG